MGRKEADALYQAIQATRIAPPATDCISPIGEELILKGLHQVVPGEFYAAATRPPAVYRGNPFQIEVGLAYGGQAATQHVTKDLLRELIEETDARTDPAVSDPHVQRPGRRRGRQDHQESAPRHAAVALRASSRRKSTRCSTAMKNVNVAEGQTMEVLRYANRVPLQFQPAACAITQTVLGTNWRSYGLSQSRGSLPKGPVTLMVHIASVWVPFTSESKEAVASYPEIQKELRLALQAVGRKLGMYVRRRMKVKQQGDRREDFPALPGRSGHGRERDQRASTATQLYDQLVARRQEAHRRRRHETRRPRPADRRRASSTWATTC